MLTGSAETAIEDVAGSYAGSEHLAPIRFRQVELAFVACIPGRLPFGKKLREVTRHGCSYFITATADTGANCGVQVRWCAREFSSHLLNRARDDFDRSAAPACVYRANDVPARIEKQNRNTISGSNPDGLADFVRYESVALLLAILQSVRIPHAIGMHLAQRDLGGRVRLTRTEAVLLPGELLESLAAINAVGAQVEGIDHGRRWKCFQPTSPVQRRRVDACDTTRA